MRAAGSFLLVAMISFSQCADAQNHVVIAVSSALDGKGKVLHDTRIVVSGSKIIAIDRKASPIDYDLRGLTVMPGWIDSHVHITSGFGPDGKNAGMGAATLKKPSRASQAITEGRDAVQGLRLSTVEKNDLNVAIRTVGEELASAESNESSPEFKVVVEGISRNLHPILRDEIYRLATEALRNAFRHAAAKSIEVEIRYDEKYFRVRIRDDGKGVPSDVLSGRGREGHYGLHGMRERAKLVGGKLTIWTELDSGTEIEIIIPGARAYVKSTRSFWYFGKRSAAETDEKEIVDRE